MHPQFFFTHSSCEWTTKACSALSAFTKLHPSNHLNPSQPDYVMWQSPPFKVGQPYAYMCHYPCKHICTNYTLPHHHLPQSHTWNPNYNLPPLPPSPCRQPPLSTVATTTCTSHDHHHRNAPEITLATISDARQPSHLQHTSSSHGSLNHRWQPPQSPCRPPSSRTICNTPSSRTTATTIFAPDLRRPRITVRERTTAAPPLAKKKNRSSTIHGSRANLQQRNHWICNSRKCTSIISAPTPFTDLA